MKTKTSKNAIRIRSLILLPLLAVLIYGFSSRNLVEIPTEYPPSPANYENGIPYDIPIQKSASRKQMAEYDAIVKKLNAQPEGERIIRQKDVERIKYIYSIMSDKQKADAEPFPKLAPPPPKVKELKDAKVAAKVIKEQKELALIQEKKTHAAELKVLKEKQKQEKLAYVQQKKEMQKLKTENAVATEASKEAMQVQKLNYIKEKEALKAAKLKHLKEIEASKAQKVKYQKQKELADLKKVKEIARADIPPPPPPPKSPVDHVVSMAKEGAIFYLEGKEISSDKAISVLKKNKSLNIQTRHDHSEQTKVYISKKPINIKED